MELRQYLHILRRRWWMPVLLALAVGLLSAWQLRPWQPPPVSYQASMRLLIGVQPVTTADTAAYDPVYYAWLTSEYLVDDFTEVVRSQLFATKVSERLDQQGIQIPPGLIQGGAATGRQHRIITLSFGWPDPQQAAEIAQAAAAELSQNAAFYFSQLGTENAAITIMDGPNVAESGPSLRTRLEWPLRVLLSLLVGVGLVFLLEYLDESVRTAAELEELGFRVLGSIPKL
ncbi:MAG: hypothetical protein R2911_13770 [Caldilineaceae bacterium]